MPSTEAKAVGCGCMTIASCIMLALSFSILSPQQYGLHYNAVARTLDEDVYNNGRWFLGLGHEFIKFPRKFQYIEYSKSKDGGEDNTPITCWSKDGQEIMLEVGLYYYFMREKLVDLYYKFRTGVEPVIEKVSRHAIRDTCVKFNTIQFFEDRVSIQAAFKAVVNKRLIRETFVAVPLFNLMSIDVPTLFEGAVNAKIITKQRERTLQYKRYTEVTRAKIGVLVASAQKNITLIKAAAQYDARLAVAAAEAGVLTEVLPMESTMHKRVMDTLFAGNADADLALVTAGTAALQGGAGAVAITETTKGGSGAVAAVQTVVCTATGGTFTLSHGGETTTALAFDATQAQVQAAFQGMSTVDATSTVTFSGATACLAAPGNTMTFTFAGAPAPQATLTSTGTGGPALVHASTVTGMAAATEKQAAVCTGASGTFTLSYRGQETRPLAFDATATAVQTAFAALSSVADTATVAFSTGVSACTAGGTNTMSLTFADDIATMAKTNLLHYVWATMMREKHDQTEFMVGFNGGTNLAVQ